ncbi:uncharacterized protein LOC141696265 [Apium graveolens]|uniref:uncharacterized protein LOC141696265 n=1 Tax=Apium graveolens TaxID=4045 RepID=UPI003D7B1C69
MKKQKNPMTIGTNPRLSNDLELQDHNMVVDVENCHQMEISDKASLPYDNWNYEHVMKANFDPVKNKSNSHFPNKDFLTPFQDSSWARKFGIAADLNKKQKTSNGEMKSQKRNSPLFPLSANTTVHSKMNKAAENQNSGISPKTPVPDCYGNMAPLSPLSMNTLPSKNSAYSPQTHFSPNVPKLKENQISSSKHTRKKCNNRPPSFNHFREGNKSEGKKAMAEFNAMPVKNFNFDDTTPNNTSHQVYDLVVKEYASLGAPDVQCPHCHAWMWKQELANKNVTRGPPVFSLCCAKGQIQLPNEPPTPSYIWQLHNDKEKSKRFSDGMRMFNSIFAFSSTCGKVDHSINCGGAPYVYRLYGQNHHLFGSLIPEKWDDPKFCQLYIYDTDNELGNHLKWVKVSDGETVDAEIVDGLMKMLDETNELVSRVDNGRGNHVSTSDEVAGIMVGDLDKTDGSCDIIIDSKIKGLERISDIHPKLMALQYRLLFPHGGDGLTPRLGGRLYQQYVVDAFFTIEQARLWWVHTNQSTLRSDLYSNIRDTSQSGDCDSTNLGKSFILPAGFVGSRRYMQQNFQDALAVCRSIEHPDIFLTMTTNPLWDEIIQMMKHIPLCSPQNSPDVIARVFRLKLDQIVEDIKKKNYFVMYVVEFQKRGLPHVHMLIWLDSASKHNLQANIDKYVSAEIPDPLADPVAYAAVKSHMIHGPCGVEFPNSRCMKQHKCIRHFPKKYSPSTIFDQSGFPIYKRRKTNFTISFSFASFILFAWKKNCTFRSNEPLAKVAAREKDKLTQLEAYFVLNGKDSNARKYPYVEIPKYYVWNKSDRFWNLRKRGKQIGRLSYCHHSSGELWYLRLLLTKVRGATSYEDLRTVDGKSLEKMIDDILLNQRKITGNQFLILNDKQLEFYALSEIHKLLKSIGKSLKDFDQMPQPPETYLDFSDNNLIIEERSYDIAEMEKEYAELISNCNAEQLAVFNAVMESVRNKNGGLFFMYGSGGCGKTYLWRTIISKLRSESQIVLPVASSGIAATLMPGGRTTHSRFKIPIALDDISTCAITHQSDIAQLIKITSLIIWDEAPM